MSLEESKTILNDLQTKQSIVLAKFIEVLKIARRDNHRIWLAGNGGSSNLVSHFAHDLMALGFDVYCMTDSVSRITAVTNDYSWEEVYSKQLTHFKPEDILILASVHGGRSDWSSNLILAAEEALHKKGITLSLLGCDGGELKNLSDVSIIIPSDKTCYVESFHSLLMHIICEQLKEVK